MDPARPRFATTVPGPLLVLLAAFALQLPLALVPGYFSHDELEWGWRAGTMDFVPWIDDRSTFQHRPLTFNLWMALSRAFFDTPQAFHSVLVLWGSANAALLCAVGRRFGMSPWTAACGALAFVLSPYAAYTHGWVATIADLIWVSCALGLAWCVLRFSRPVAIAAAAFGFALAGILGKEAAAAIPVLCAVAFLLDDARRKRWLAATIGSGLSIALFLAWRLPALLHAPRDGGALYVPRLSNVPVRWFEYQVFPVLAMLFEAQTTLIRGWGKVAVAALLWMLLVCAVWRARPRLAIAFLAGGVAALAPVLVLGVAWNHYAYGFAAVAAMCVAAAWPRASRPGRGAIAVFAVLTALHAGLVMVAMREVARVQSVFTPALAATLEARSGDVRLRVSPQARPWIFRRLAHGQDVSIVEADAPADFEIQPDGSLRPLR
jgi:hypothetical protein